MCTYIHLYNCISLSLSLSLSKIHIYIYIYTYIYIYNRELQYRIPRLHSPANSRRLPEMLGDSCNNNIFAPVGFRRKPDPQGPKHKGWYWIVMSYVVAFS